MAVRRVPEDYPDVQSAIDASAPGDRIEVGIGVSPTAAVAVDGLTIDQSGGFFDSGTFTLGPGVRSLALPGPTLFRATGNDGDNVIVGGTASGYLYGRGGGDVLIGGPQSDWMEGGTGNDTYEVDDAAGLGGFGGGNRIALFRGDQVVERPDEGWDVVWSSADFTLPGNVEGLVLTGGARKGYGNEAPNLIVGTAGDNVLAGLGGDDEMRGGGGNDTYLVNSRGDRVVEEGEGTDEVWATVDHELAAGVENLFLDGAAVWGSGNALNNRIVGDDLDNRLVGWGGLDTLTGGAGDDIFYLLPGPFFRATITDFWPGAGSNDQLAFYRDLFSSREQAYAACAQRESDVWITLAGQTAVVLQNTRLTDLALDDFLIV